MWWQETVLNLGSEFRMSAGGSDKGIIAKGTFKLPIILFSFCTKTPIMLQNKPTHSTRLFSGGLLNLWRRSCHVDVFIWSALGWFWQRGIDFFKTNFSLIKMEKQVTNHIYKKRKSATSLVVCCKQFIAESWIIKQIENISKLDSKTYSFISLVKETELNPFPF